MPVSARPKKKYSCRKNERLANTKLRALIYQFNMVCEPIDRFFRDAQETGQVDDVNGMAVFTCEMERKMYSVRESAEGFIGSLYVLFDKKNLDKTPVDSMANLFMKIDTELVTFDEIDAAADAWRAVKKILGECRYGDVLVAMAEEKIRNGKDNDRCCVIN